MQYFKKPDGSVWAFEDDVTPESGWHNGTEFVTWITADMTPMTSAEIEAHLNPPLTLAGAQATQCAQLAAAYAAAIAQPVSYTSKAGVTKTYQADPASVGNLQNMLLAFSGAQATPTGFYWLSADNTQVPFSYADLQGLAAVMGVQGFAAFERLRARKAAVNAAITIAAAQAAVW